MAKHEFGIMPDPPRQGERYDTYCPQKYGCISIGDEAVEKIAPALGGIVFYHHTLDVRSEGLAYCGITLIPPRSLKVFGEAICGMPGLTELEKIIGQAEAENKWMIHFGL